VLILALGIYLLRPSANQQQPAVVTDQTVAQHNS
jgi:hypothetical protein